VDDDKVILSRGELRALIREAIAEGVPAAPHGLNHAAVEQIVRRTVGEMLSGMGVDHGDPLSLQKDFARLREWRAASEQIKSKGIVTVFMVALTGAVGALVVGLRHMWSA